MNDSTNENIIDISLTILDKDSIALNSLKDLPETSLMEVLTKYPRLLRYVNTPKQTDAVVFAALKSNALVLEYVDDQKETFCKFAIDKNIEAFLKIKKPQSIHQVFCVTAFVRNENVGSFKRFSMVRKRSIVMNEDDAVYYIGKQPEIIHYFKEITHAMIKKSVKYYSKAAKYAILAEKNTQGEFMCRYDQTKHDLFCKDLLRKNILSFKYLNLSADSNTNAIIKSVIKHDPSNYKLLKAQHIDLSFYTNVGWVQLNPKIAKWMTNISEFKEIIEHDVTYIRYYSLKSLTKEHCIHFLETLILDANKKRRNIKSILNEIMALVKNDGTKSNGSFIREICERANLPYSDIIDEQKDLRLIMNNLDNNNPFDKFIDTNSYSNRPLLTNLIRLIEGKADDEISYLEKEELLSYDGLLIGLIDDQTERLVKIALIQNPLALEFVKVKTLNFCKMAVKLNRMALDFVSLELDAYLPFCAWAFAKFGVIHHPMPIH